jgi:hypothetical protein
LLAITPPSSVAPELNPGLADAWARSGVVALGLTVLLREPGAGLAATLRDPRFGRFRVALFELGIPTLVSVAADAIDLEDLGLLDAASPAIAGVQLRGDPTVERTARWRAWLGPRVLGRSCHGLVPSLDPNVDYTCVAPVFAPRTAQLGVEKRAIGLAGLRRWTEVVPRVIALGGVDLGTAPACLAAGATGLAGISLLFGQTELGADHVAALRRAFDDDGAQA